MRELRSHKVDDKALCNDSKNLWDMIRLGQRPRSFQQNGLLGNISGNYEKYEKLGLKRVINKKAC